MSQLTIRKSQPIDAENIIAGINRVCEEGGAFSTTQFIPTKIWNDALYDPDSNPKLLLYIAEWDAQFAGSIRLFPGQQNTYLRHVAQLGMFVEARHRRKGVGTALLSTSIQWAKKQNLEKITLSVFSTNIPAIRLYKKFGFSIEGTRKYQYKNDGKYSDQVLMGIFL